MEDEDFNKYNEEEKEKEEKDNVEEEEKILDERKTDETYYYPDNYREKIRMEDNIPSFLVKEL